MKHVLKLILLFSLVGQIFGQGQAPPVGYVQPLAMTAMSPNNAFAYMNVDSSGNLNVTGSSGGFLAQLGGYIQPFAPVAQDSQGHWHYLSVDASGNLQTSGGGGGSGTVTSVTAGTGLSGGTITTSGTIAVVNPVPTGVAAGSLLASNGVSQPPVYQTKAVVDVRDYCAGNTTSSDYGLCINAATTANIGSTIDLRGLPTKVYLNSPMVTPQGYVLSAAGTASGGNTVYTGVFPAAANQLAGYTITISGFSTPANNGTFAISASTSTTIVVNNASGAAETHAALGSLAASSIYRGRIIVGNTTFFINSVTGLQTFAAGVTFEGMGKTTALTGPYGAGTNTDFELCSATDTQSSDYATFCASTPYTASLTNDGNNYPAVVTINGYLPSAGAVGTSGITLLASRITGISIGCGMIANSTAFANYSGQDGSKMDNFYAHDCTAAGDINLDIGGGTGGAQNSWYTDCQFSTLSGKTNAASAVGIRIWAATGNGLPSGIQKCTVVNNSSVGTLPNYDIEIVGGSSTAGQMVLQMNHLESAGVAGIAFGVATVKGVDQGGAVNGITVIGDNCGPGFASGTGTGCVRIFSNANLTGASVTNVQLLNLLATNATPTNVIADDNNTVIPIATHFVSRYETNGTGAVIADTSGTNASNFAGAVVAAGGVSTGAAVPAANTITGIAFVDDTNGNKAIGLTATGSAVDYLNVTNAATANPAQVTLTASGTDSNINLNLVSKGTGTVQCNGASCATGVIPTGNTLSPANLGQNASNQVWFQPPIPTFTGSDSATGGSLNCGSPHYMQVVYNSALGSTIPGIEIANTSTYISPHNCTSGSTGSITINAITLPSGYTSWTMYEATSSGFEQIVAACTNIASGSGCTITTDGSGATPPTVNTSILKPANVQATRCPPSVIPSMFGPDPSGNFETWAGADVTTNNGFTSGFWDVCIPTRFTDQKATPPGGNNAFVLIDHTFGVNTSIANQDRALWIGAQTPGYPSADTGSHYALEGLQSELDINAGTGFSLTGSISSEISDVSTNVTDNSTANYSTSAGLGVNSIRASTYINGSGFTANYAGVRANISVSSAANTVPSGTLAVPFRSTCFSSSSQTSLGCYGFLHTFSGAASGAQAAFADTNTAPGAGLNWFALNVIPGLASLLNGPVTLSAILGNASASLPVTASMNVSGSQTISQLTVPPPASVGCAGGSSTYGYKLVGVDGNGGTVASTQATCTTGVNPLTSGNPATINAPTSLLANLGGFTSIQVYRTSGPMALGLIGTMTCNAPTIVVGAISCAAFSDTGLSASGSVPTANTTGSLNVAGLVQQQSQCKVTAAVNMTVSGTAVNFCTWNLPNSAQTWAWQCSGTYTTTTSSDTFSIGMNASQTPTSETGNAIIYTTLMGTSTAGSATSASSGNQNILTGASVSSVTNEPFSVSGTIQASATLGTFALSGTLTGTSPSGSVNPGTTCILY